MMYAMNRSSRPEVFCEKGVLGNLTKFTGKSLCERAQNAAAELEVIYTNRPQVFNRLSQSTR